MMIRYSETSGSNRPSLLTTSIAICIGAACYAQPVENPHSAPRLDSSRHDRSPPPALSDERGGVCSFTETFQIPIGDFGYSAVLTATMRDLDGDGFIRADSGFYDAYNGPTEVEFLTIVFTRDGSSAGSFQNVFNSQIVYEFLYFEWNIAAASLTSWDLGADPGVFTFGGSAVTPAPGAYFRDVSNDLGGELGGMPSIPLCVSSELQSAFIPTLDVTQDVASMNGFAFFADSDGGVRILDVTDASIPVEVGHFMVDGARRLEATDGYVIASAGTGCSSGSGACSIYIIDVANPAAPFQQAIAGYDTSVEDIAVEGDRLYVAAGVMYIYDIAARPLSLGGPLGLPTANVKKVVPNGDIAYVVGDDPRLLRILDVSNPVVTSPIAEVALPEPIMSIAADGGTLYIGTSSNELYVIDTQVPSAPEVLRSVILPSAADELVLDCSVLLAASPTTGIHLFNLDDGCGPRITGSVTVLAGARDITLVDGVAFVAAGVNGLRAADTTNCSDADGNGVRDACEPVQNISTGLGYGTIQGAIDVANSGHTIRVGPGTYNEKVNTLGKNITMESSDGPEVTVIDGTGHDGAAVQFDSGESPLFSGFTVTGASTGNEGGLGVFNGSSPHIRDCVITQNRTSAGGARVIGTPLFERVVFIDNEAMEFNGGGVSDDFSETTGGMYVNCQFIGNHAFGSGGGFAAIDSSPTLINCVFANNTCNMEGGGFVSAGFFATASPTLVNCTITENIGGDGDGVAALRDSAITATNCIIVSNGVLDISVAPTSSIDFSYSMFPNASGTNIDADPQFTNPDAGDYGLEPGSPAIDAANADALDPSILTDADGSPRYYDDPDSPNSGVGLVAYLDIGALERQESGSTSECIADFAGPSGFPDGVLNFDDVLAFLQAFNHLDQSADLAPPHGVIDFNDVLAFLSAFNSGCFE